MGAPSEPERVDLNKPAAGEHAAGEHAEESFDPYRFGAPDVPPPPEFAPPGYRAPPGYQPPAAQQPTGQPQNAQYPPYPYGTTAPGQSPYGPPPGYPQQPYGQSPYNQNPYGQQPYGPGPQQGQGNGKAVAGLVLGIISIVLFWTTFFDAVFVLLALIFGFLGLNDSGRRGGRGRGQAIAGLVCAAVGAVLATVFLVFLLHLANKCGGFDNQNNSGFQQCLRDNI